jgi:hypothetical protein
MNPLLGVTAMEKVIKPWADDVVDDALAARLGFPFTLDGATGARSIRW